MQELKVPDIGDYKDIPVIEILVKVGDTVAKDQSIVTLESDKATMEVPADVAGVIKELRVKLNDKVSMGSVVAIIEAGAAQSPPPPGGEGLGERASAVAATSAPAPTPAPSALPANLAPAPTPSPQPSSPGGGSQSDQTKAHATPSVRKFARELGVDLNRVKPTGPKNRVLHEDVQGFVKGVMSGAVHGTTGSPRTDGDGAALGLLPWPKVDFAKFGAIETKPLSRIKKISGANLHRNWVMIPHVTNHDEADITELEAFRVKLNEENAKAGIKVTMLAFMIKAAVMALKKFPDFNASLDGENLIVKNYFTIGFAADTPNGLVVPVIKNADTKGVFEISKEMGELAGKAREGKLGPADMQGGCFSISSLGGIGGTYFTPIINAPEVAIMGVCKSEMKPKWNGKEFEPRLMLPLSLSWDHRVIDGASAARFNVYFAALLSDFRRAVL
ncbi:MAG: dihydrolipoyllysine-residue acetyltransferase [Burkholderiales bacterium]|nr:MAG: dihydrolipoyllysine-residue acetyltransferase [Betaproteobacteria bacterium]TAG24514.1 MAG: dihydrolipoyllysine-residue acetyltransferase [Burkholderiales bacterium]